MVADRIVGVWGANGYLGSHASSHLRATADVRCLARDALPTDESALVDASFPRDYKDAVIRTGYLQRITSRAQAAAALHIPYVYIASMSSLPPVTSVYGRVKADAESIVTRHAGVLLRAGLVVSATEPGGRFAQLAGIARRLPLLPLPHPSQFRVHVTSLEDVLRDLAAVVEDGRGAHGHVVAGTSELSLTELLEAASASRHRVIRLGPTLSRAAARVARHLHVGPLDSLASIAVSARRDPMGGGAA